MEEEDDDEDWEYWEEDEPFILYRNVEVVRSNFERPEPEMEEDGFPSKEWLVSELGFFEELAMEQEAQLLYHANFDTELILSLWRKGELDKLGKNGANN